MVDKATTAFGRKMPCQNPLDCPVIRFPAATYKSYNQDADLVERQSWYGSLIEEKSDDSGLMYMRNRYYNPATGSFTQEDPIGISGGLNTYGFAGGDPATYSDPFGLCPYATEKSAKTNTDASDCPKDAVGDGTRALQKYGGARAQQAIKHMASKRLTPVLTSYSQMQSVCGSTSAGACITGTGKIILPSSSTADMATHLMHEIGHDMIPNVGTWDKTYMHEEPIVAEWGARMWGKMPSNLRPAQGGMGIFYQEWRRNPVKFRQDRAHVACELVTRRGGEC
jgi:RHS repeat-associated protein